jgi:hypothetical protein
VLRRGLDWLRPAPEPLPLTRNEFYRLASSCPAYAQELARLDPQRVNLRACHQFNDWLRHVRRYDLLAPGIRDVTFARPVARWQLAILGLLLMIALWLVLPGRVERTVFLLVVNSLMFMIISLFMLPESIYGTTVEMIEAKVLRVVLELEALLQHDALQFTDAAFFKARDNLEAARVELRQQLDAAHRT